MVNLVCIPRPHPPSPCPAGRAAAVRTGVVPLRVEATVGGKGTSALTQGLRGLRFRALTWKRRLHWAWEGYRAENLSQERKKKKVLSYPLLSAVQLLRL